MTPLCLAIVDTDPETEHDIACGDEAVFLCCGEPRCDQCAHDWLDELDVGAEHTVEVLEQDADVKGEAN